MFYLEAVQPWPQQAWRKSVFAAGGISACPDWQSELRACLAPQLDDVLFVNPRRENFPIHDPAAAELQIAWEFEQLRRVDAILFWFPYETLCPIALLELGTWLAKPTYTEFLGNEIQYHFKPLFIGCHHDYQRIQDVIIQTRLARPEIEVVFSLEDLAQQVIAWAGRP